MSLILVAICAVILIAWDIYTLVKNGVQSTISWEAYQISMRNPIIPFALGILFGHLFWVQKGA